METTSKPHKYFKAINIIPAYVKVVKDKKAECEKCKKYFKVNTLLMEINNSISFSPNPFGIGIKGIVKGKNTYFMVSPCCKKAHLFGFKLK